MPYQLRDSTSVPNAEPTPSSAASSVTVEHNKDAPNELPFKGLGTNYLQKGFSGSAKPVANQSNVISDEELPPQKRKRTGHADIANDRTMQNSIIKNLDMLHEGLERSQRILAAILGQIEAEHKTLVFESFIERQRKKLLVAPTRRLFEHKFHNIQNQVRILVADIGEDIWTQQYRVNSMKLFIQQNAAGKEGI